MRTMHRSGRNGTNWQAALLVTSFALTAAACSQGPNAMTGPSAIGGSQAKPGGVSAAAAGTTVVTFENYNPADLTVTINTTTASALGQPYIDEGKIQLQYLADINGNPLPCGSAGGDWVRFDTYANGGQNPASGVTTGNFDLNDINAVCGQSICIRAHYVTGGGQTKVDTHQSDPTPFEVVCPSCTYTQGYWKTHGPIPMGGNSNEWPVTSLMLGTVNYTDLQLLAIFNEPVAGNGLISLAHQLIAAKLNIANGASAPAEVTAAIAAADALIGGLVIPPVGSGYLAPATTSALTGTLGSYNEGIIGPGHCEGD